MVAYEMLMERRFAVGIVTASQEILRPLYLQLIVLSAEINGHVVRNGVTFTPGLIRKIY